MKCIPMQHINIGKCIVIALTLDTDRDTWLVNHTDSNTAIPILRLILLYIGMLPYIGGKIQCRPTGIYHSLVPINSLKFGT